jgi:hypothetical protein
MLLQYNRLDKKSVIEFIINLLDEFNFPEDELLIIKKGFISKIS